MPMLIQNARVIDPSQGLDKVMDLLLEDGKIAQLGSNLSTQNAQVVDGTGLVAAPGLVDMHGGGPPAGNAAQDGAGGRDTAAVRTV